MANKKIGGVESDVIVVGGLAALAYFGLVKPILGNLGIDPADKDAVDSVDTLDNPGNPFSINFEYSLYAQAPGAYGKAYWQSVVAIAQDGNPHSGGVFNYMLAGDNISNAIGNFAVYAANVNYVFDTFFNTQADVSNTAAYLYFIEDLDLYSLLKNGRQMIPFWHHGMPTSDLATIVRKVNNLPPR